VIEAIRKIMAPDTAGDPMTGLKWTRKTTAKIRRQLRRMGLHVSARTVARLLRGLDYSLRVNRKLIATASSPDRNRQFEYINKQRRAFQEGGLPAVSIDTKKKEMLGRFKNPGRVWADGPVRVNDHDFRRDSVGLAIPYGVFDTQANRGHIFVGTSHDTAEFAVDALAKWWKGDGQRAYPDARRLLVLADGGGSNGPRIRAWKHSLQTRFVDAFGVAVTVCHYPPGASKWNPIEHRLFSEVSKNWAARPLDSYETMLNYIRTTTTASGLRVKATLLKGDYLTGKKLSDTEMNAVNLRLHRVLPVWNYTISPN
jgi:hypothetical protein